MIPMNELAQVGAHLNNAQEVIATILILIGVPALIGAAIARIWRVPS